MFSGSKPETSSFIDLKGKYKSKYLTFRDKLSKPDWIEHFLRITHVENMDFAEVIKKYDSPTTYIYLDPPYNEHPYGSNYFMLNLIANGQEPVDCSKVSGIPKLWNKSAFNGRNSAFDAMVLLLTNCLQKARYVLISYNNEGLITDWSTIFQNLQCNVKKYEKEYDTYHGSRNLNGRNMKVVEIMYLLSKKN